MVVITGIGANFIDGKLKEFWEYQNSWGNDWGVNGFGRFIKGKNIILRALQFEFEFEVLFSCNIKIIYY